MKIMVFDVAAESGGALSVLNDFYNEYKMDINNEYIFVVSKPELTETENIRILRYPWIKKSWIHRLYFDNIVAPKLVENYEVDQVFSLQNVIIPHVKKYQTVYIHNCLPFVEYKFSIFENRLLWIYQNVLSEIIFKSIEQANKVIVQTNWMKNICIKKLYVNDSKIIVMPPKINVEVKKFFTPTRESLTTFFYPASDIDFKNHKIIIEACLKLKSKGIVNYKVIFTLKGNENKNISDLYDKAKENDLPVSFISNISRDKVFDYYTKSILIFPSYIESSPLPLTEAKMHMTPIIASDCHFSHEILDEYAKVRYFDPFNSDMLMNEMLRYIKNSCVEVQNE